MTETVSEAALKALLAKGYLVERAEYERLVAANADLTRENAELTVAYELARDLLNAAVDEHPEKCRYRDEVVRLTAELEKAKRLCKDGVCFDERV